MHTIRTDRFSSPATDLVVLATDLVAPVVPAAPAAATFFTTLTTRLAVLPVWLLAIFLLGCPAGWAEDCPHSVDNQHRSSSTTSLSSPPTPPTPPTATASMVQAAPTELPAVFRPEIIPPVLREGWLLSNWTREEKPIPYLNLPGWQIEFNLPNTTDVGSEDSYYRLTVLVLDCPDAALAKEAWHDLTELSPLPRRHIDVSGLGITAYDFQKGRRETPSASAVAEPPLEYRSTIHRPPYLLQALSHNCDHGPSEIMQILECIRSR